MESSVLAERCLEFLHERQKISIRIIRSPRRRTLEIAVRRDGDVLVRVPASLTQGEVRQRLAKRLNWIVQKQQELRKRPPARAPRTYVNGETHSFLGRQYRLRAQQADRCGVELKQGWMYVYAQEHTPAEIAGILRAWYFSQAAERFRDMYDRIWPQFRPLGYARPKMHIKDMRSKWGSLSAKGNMSINLRLIKAPPAWTEYVLIHELCHLRHQNHRPEFYKMVASYLPDWLEREKQFKKFSQLYL